MIYDMLGNNDINDFLYKSLVKAIRFHGLLHLLKKLCAHSSKTPIFIIGKNDEIRQLLDHNLLSIVTLCRLV